MDRTLVVALFFCVLAVCLATNDQNSDKNSGEPGAKLSMKKRGKEDEDDAKVEVVQDEKDESAKERKASDGLATEKKDIANEKVHGGTKKNEGHDETKDDDEDHDDEEHDDEDDEEEDEEHEEEEEEEVDPNAKIEIHDLFTPEDCKNKSKSGDLVVIHYSGWLDDGKLFDTTVEPSKAYMPFEFMLGTGTVIKGFEQGVLNMCKGQKRKIVIPPSLGYGKKGAGAIPGETEFVYSSCSRKMSLSMICFDFWTFFCLCKLIFLRQSCNELCLDNSLLSFSAGWGAFHFSCDHRNTLLRFKSKITASYMNSLLKSDPKNFYHSFHFPIKIFYRIPKNIW